MMDTMPSLFVSFSGRSHTDKLFAVRLLARLKQQGFAPWVYEQRGDEIAPGDHINDACRRHIRKADIFVCIISDSSLTSPSTAMEVDFAATVLGPGDIFQVATTTVAQQLWPEPYRSLLPYKHVDAFNMGDADLERVLRDLCQRSGMVYTPPADEVPRLPLIRRLTRELQHASPAIKAYESATYERMLRYAMDAATAYADRRIEHAFSSISTLDYELRREYPDDAFYYPRLVKAILLLELPPSNPHYLVEAQKILEDIVCDSSLADKRDENTDAALAVIALRRNAPREALAHYQKAHELVTARGEVDPDILHNIVVASIAAETHDTEVNIDALLEQALHGGVTSDALLLERLTALRAAYLASRGDLDGATAILRGMDVDDDMCIDILCRVAQELAAHPMTKFRYKATAHVEDLFDIVVARGNREQRNAALLSQAGFRYSQGRFEDALGALDAVDQTIACQSHLLLERALILLNMDELERAEQLLTVAADSTVTGDLGPALHGESLYYRGFAAWLLDRRDAAMRDFKDSQFDDALAYPIAAQRHLQAAGPAFAFDRHLADLGFDWTGGAGRHPLH